MNFIPYLPWLLLLLYIQPIQSQSNIHTQLDTQFNNYDKHGCSGVSSIAYKYGNVELGWGPIGHSLSAYIAESLLSVDDRVLQSFHTLVNDIFVNYDNHNLIMNSDTTRIQQSMSPTNVLTFKNKTANVDQGVATNHTVAAMCTCTTNLFYCIIGPAVQIQCSE